MIWVTRKITSLRVLQMGQAFETLALLQMLPFLCMCACLHMYTVTEFISQNSEKAKYISNNIFFIHDILQFALADFFLLICILLWS